MNKSLFLLLVLLLTGCASFQVSTLNHDPIYAIEGSDAEITVIDNEFELRRLLRTDFNFRYDFAQYAQTLPITWHYSNRFMGFNRYNRFNNYSSFYYSYSNRHQMWNDWVWGYNWYSPHPMSSFGNNWGSYQYYSWNNYGWNNYGWNGYYGNNWGWRQHRNNHAWSNRNRPNTVNINGRRGYKNTQSRIVTNNTNRTRVVITKPRINNKPRVVINNKPRINNSRPITNPIPRQRVNTPTRTRSIPNNNTRSSNNTTIRSNSKRNN